MRIPVSVTDQGFYFLGTLAGAPVVGATDDWTVEYSKNGAATWTVMTTPTITEVDDGGYWLLCDEGMTLTAGNQSEAMLFRISHDLSEVDDVFKEIEIYRPTVTAGETLTVASGVGQASVQSIVASAITAASIASSAITAAKIDTGAITAAKFAANAITSTVVADGTITNTKFATAAITAAVLATDCIGSNELASTAIAEIADGVWDEDITGHTAGNALGAYISAIFADTNALDLDWANGGRLDLIIDAILADTAEIGAAGAGLTALATQASVNTIDGIVDAILLDTAEIGAAGAGLTALATQASVDTIDGIVDAILLDTAEIGAAGAGLTALATQASVNTIDGIVDAILLDTTEIGAAGAGLTALATQASVDTIDGIVDAILLDTAEIGAAGAGLTALATQASVDTIDGIVDAILLDTAEIGAAGAGLTTLATAAEVAKIPKSDGTTSWNATALAAINAEVDTALDTAISELGVGVPTATPSVRTGVMLMYMALRNKLDVQTSGTDSLEVHNDAGTLITQKLITDDGTDYSEAKMT